MRFLWTGTGVPPAEWLEFRLKELYHCTSAQLDAEPPDRVMTDLVCLSVKNSLSRRRRVD